MQVWVPIEVQLCQDGTLDHANFVRIAISEELQDIRSKQAEAATTKFAQLHRLPAAAANGGRVGANAKNDEEVELSEGVTHSSSILACLAPSMLILLWFAALR